MNQSGRVSFITLLGAASVILIVTLLLLSRESLSSVGGRFMSALARKDVEALTKLTHLGNRSPEEIRKQWDFTVNTAGKYYNFQYRVVSATQSDANSASVKLQVVRNSDQQSSFDENFQLPLIKVGEEWKVDVRGISRDFYPGLPR